MEEMRVVEQRAPYLLIALDGHFAVVERCNGKLYNLHCGHRGPALMSDAGARFIVGKDWCDERSARRLFDEVATRYADLAEHLW